MGFFSDLKDDLSQAVNELMPEEGESMEAAEENMFDSAQGTETEIDVTSNEDLAQLDALLEKVDSIELPEEMAELEVTAEEETSEEEAEEPEMDLETSIREAFGEKEEIKGEEKKMDTQTRTAIDETAIITAGMVITGDITSEGSMEVVGTINGNIDIFGKLNITGTIVGNSKAAEIYADNAKITGEVISEGAVKIGQSSVIIGNISAKSAVIAGAVKGDIDVQGPVILDTSAIVMGNIKSKAVQINNGAVIEGMCSQCYADVNPTAFFDEYKKNKNK